MSWHESKQKNSQGGCSERKKLWNKFHLHNLRNGGSNHGGEISPLPPLINLRHRPTRQTPMIGYGNCATPFLTHPIPLFPLHYF